MLRKDSGETPKLHTYQRYDRANTEEAIAKELQRESPTRPLNFIEVYKLGTFENVRFKWKNPQFRHLEPNNRPIDGILGTSQAPN